MSRRGFSKKCQKARTFKEVRRWRSAQCCLGKATSSSSSRKGANGGIRPLRAIVQ